MNRRRWAGFTVVEMMIVVAIVGILATFTVPAAIKARTKSRESICLNNQRQIDSAKELFAMDYRKGEGALCAWDDILPYLRNKPVCPAGGEYQIEPVGSSCYCPLHDYRAN